MSTEKPTRSSSPSSLLRTGLILLAVLTAAVFLRFDDLAEPSLWYDEIQHHEKALETLDEPWHAWLTGVSADRENGSLYYAGQVLGLSISNDEFGVRFAPALAGVVAVIAVFFIALAASGDPRAAGVAAAFLAVAPLHVYYSREGRPYAAIMLAASLLLLTALNTHRSWARRLIYPLCLATAYLGVVAAPLLIACGGLAVLELLSNRDGDRGGKHVLGAAALGLGLSLLLFPTAERLGTTIGKGKPTATTLEITSPLSETALDRLLASYTVSGVDWGTASALSIVFVLLAVWGAISLQQRDLSKALWTTGLFFLPLIGMLMVLVIFDHWYNVRYTSAGLPAFAVLVGLGLTDLRRRFGGSSIAGDVALVVVVALLLTPLWKASRSEPLQKPDWRGVATRIADLAEPGEPVIARGSWADRCIRYYFRQLEIPIDVHSAFYDHATAKKLAAEHPRAWVLAAGYRKAPEFQAWMNGLHPVLKSRLGEIELLFSPDFGEYLASPKRIAALTARLQETSEFTPRQEFADSDLLLGTGWSYPEVNEGGRTFRWASAEQAQIALPAPFEPGPRFLRLRVLPFPRPDGRKQTVAVSVGADASRRALGEIVLEPGWNRLDLPAYDGQDSIDLITFDFAWGQSPRDIDPASSDSRRLAAAFDFVTVLPADSPE